MEKQEILGKVQNIFREILDNEDICISATSTADDIEEWDSLTNIQLVVAIEKLFNIKFTSKEIASWTNIGDMLDCIASK